MRESLKVTEPILNLLKTVSCCNITVCMVIIGANFCWGDAKGGESVNVFKKGRYKQSNEKDNKYWLR